MGMQPSERQRVVVGSREIWDPLGLMARAEGLITGTVVCAAVIAATAGHVDRTYQLSTAILVSSFVYWLAHVHAHAIGAAIVDEHHPGQALRGAVAQTWTVLAACLLPLVVLLAARLAGADLLLAAYIALYAAMGLLGVYSYLAGRRGGLGIRWSLVCALAGTALGGLVVVLKAVFLH